MAAAIDAAQTLAEMEDLYRPYKQKRRTRATVAREKGLEPLARTIFDQEKGTPAPEVLAAEYIDAEKGVETVEDALAGASDIIAEWISDDADIRKVLRQQMMQRGQLGTRAAKEDTDSVYRLYYDFTQPLNKLQSHQILAINRGEKEEFLKVSVEADREQSLRTIFRSVVVPGSSAMAFVRSAAEDAYDRLLEPSMEREIRSALTETANEAAIHNFALNLKPLLLQPPVKGKVTMGLDPGYRNGCKVAVVDGTGRVLDTAVVYPTFSEKKKEEAITILSGLVKKHGVEHLAIGNGTASRETEQMAVELIRRMGGGLSYMMVNEAGASVYSASKLAAEEFPQFDVNLRSAVSIARRLQDPLAELVKIEPKAIGVGQYQHDMPEKQLDAVLGGVVEDCVNAVGVDVNTASAPLLKQVAGLTATTAKNIVAYREENGSFTSRKQLLKVPKLGPKAFEQCAGFLRVPESKQVLDHTAVHPESYDAAEKLLTLCGYTAADVGTAAIDALTANMQAFTRAASILGVFVVGALTVTMGTTQINLTIPNGTTRGLSAQTIVVSNEEAENFADLAIDTETADAGAMGVTDMDGNPLTAADVDSLASVVARNVSIKRDVVSADERERGLRQTLNLGHTIGHAIEAAGDFSLGHGSCVAAGLCMMARAASRCGWCSADTAERIERCAEAHGLPTSTDLPTETLMRYVAHDKKRHGDSVNIVVPLEVGRCEVRAVSLDELRRLIDLGR